MLVTTKIRLENDDQAIARKIEEALALIGGNAWDEDDARLKPFRHIRSREFEYEHALEAYGTIVAETKRLRESADVSACPFPEIPGRKTSVAQEWQAGIVETANAAEHRAEDFLEMIDVDLMKQGREDIFLAAIRQKA